MDFVLLCVTIAVELNKDQWKRLCGQKQFVQADLIIEQLKSINNVDFKLEAMELFENNFNIVQEHLQQHY
jgi:hypothetical protein